eukprot:141218-Prorocentrum_minimum.AAC.1
MPLTVSVLVTERPRLLIVCAFVSSRCVLRRAFSATDTRLLTVEAESNVTLRGLVFANAPPTSTVLEHAYGGAVFVGKRSFVRFEDCSFTNVTTEGADIGAAVHIGAASGAAFVRVSFSGCRANEGGA